MTEKCSWWKIRSCSFRGKLHFQWKGSVSGWCFSSVLSKHCWRRLKLRLSSLYCCWVSTTKCDTILTLDTSILCKIKPGNRFVSKLFPKNALVLEISGCLWRETLLTKIEKLSRALQKLHKSIENSRRNHQALIFWY